MSGYPQGVSKRDALRLWGLTQRGPCPPRTLVFGPWPHQTGTDMLVALAAPDGTGGVLGGALCSRTSLRLWEATPNFPAAGLCTKPRVDPVKGASRFLGPLLENHLHSSEARWERGDGAVNSPSRFSPSLHFSSGQH